MTTHLPHTTYEKYWREAVEQEIGVLIQVHPEDQALLVNDLYECRKQVGGYENLMILQPQPPGTIFIAKKAVELD